MEHTHNMQWLPTTLKEVKQRGWETLDVILFSGDAYVDHPSFGAAVIGRVLESMGLKVAIVPQPNWQDDLRDFKKLGRPNLFFGISPGSMDSMINHYTAAKRRRSTDAYTPDGKIGMRPDRPSIVYSRILKELYPDVPIILGGIEASLRRLSHYDYWEDTIRPSILMDAPADILIYGMGEKPIREIVQLLKRGVPLAGLTNIPQTVVKLDANQKYASNKKWETIELFSHEEALKDKQKYTRNFRHIEEESNSVHAAKITQRVGDKLIVVNPPYPPLSTKELDEVYDLPFTRLPHPKYKGKEIPAYSMICHSITMHRGCFGGCAFCTISAHQGKFISSRSPESILREVETVADMPDFKGTISDLGGPSANMYNMHGKDTSICERCKKPSCLAPTMCKNLNNNHQPLLDLLAKVRQNPRIKHCFIGSGIRYDLCLTPCGNKEIDSINAKYLENVIRFHVSGRFKVAPEHTSPKVLQIMRKPDFQMFYTLKSIFDNVNRKYGLKQQLIPYFISSHPGCTIEDMAELAIETKNLDFKLEQVQDFTPTPMTVATTIYASGFHPYSLKPIPTIKNATEKKEQNNFFFWYKPELKKSIITTLKRINRPDLIKKLFS